MKFSSPRSSVQSFFRSAVLLPVMVLRTVLLLPTLLAAWTLVRGSAKPAPIVQAHDPILADDASVELSVVIPFYNPGDALRPTVERLATLLRARGGSFEILAVSDGSTDGSEHTLEGLGDEVKVLVAPQNMGKGAALHRGFAQAKGQWVGFIDADGDIDPSHVVDYLARAQAGDHEVVFASKRHEFSRSSASRVRKMVSMGFIGLVKFLFAMPVDDTQTGCKVFRRDALARTLPQLQEHRFAFDLEFFVAATAAGVRNMVSAPVELKERMAGSSVGSSAILRTLRDALVIFARLHLHRTYHAPATVPAQRTTPALAAANTTTDATIIPFPTTVAPEMERMAA